MLKLKLEVIISHAYAYVANEHIIYFCSPHFSLTVVVIERKNILIMLRVFGYLCQRFSYVHFILKRFKLV